MDGRGDPRRVVHLCAFGWTQEKTLWAHYFLGTKRIKSVRIGALQGACGDLTTRIGPVPTRRGRRVDDLLDRLAGVRQQRHVDQLPRPRPGREGHRLTGSTDLSRPAQIHRHPDKHATQRAARHRRRGPSAVPPAPNTAHTTSVVDVTAQRSRCTVWAARGAPDKEV
jgi:hypothetical protein